jgi:hypothetical protein
VPCAIRSDRRNAKTQNVCSVLTGCAGNRGVNAAASVYARLKVTRADDYFFDERQLNASPTWPPPRCSRAASAGIRGDGRMN